MKTTPSLLLTLALVAPALATLGQDGNPNPPRGPRPAQREGAPPDGQRPPRRDGTGDQPRPAMSPLLAALDANSDGVIDEKEIENASAALKKLDKNGDGKVTMDEIRPTRPQPGGPGVPGVDRGDRRPDGPTPGDGPRPQRPGQRPPPGDQQ